MNQITDNGTENVGVSHFSTLQEHGSFWPLKLQEETTLSPLNMFTSWPDYRTTYRPVKVSLVFNMHSLTSYFLTSLVGLVRFSVWLGRAW